MSQPEVFVKEFKEHVDATITNTDVYRRKNEEEFGSRVAASNELVYLATPYSDQRKSIRSIVGEGDEFRWSVFAPAMTRDYTGHVALVAVAGENRSLLRRWRIQSPYRFVPIVVQQEIFDPIKLYESLAWVHKPDLFPKYFNHLSKLSQEESDVVTKEYRRKNKQTLRPGQFIGLQQSFYRDILTDC